ncbi:MAG: hypothetical protein ACREPT_00810 [Rudaea sp.]
MDDKVTVDHYRIAIASVRKLVDESGIRALDCVEATVAHLAEIDSANMHGKPA